MLVVSLLAVLGCGEQAQAPTTPETGPSLATTTSALAFRQVSAGDIHTCALTTTNRAYCWGWNVFGQIGNGTSSFARLTPALVAGGLQFRQISAGQYTTCGVTTEYQAYCWGLNDQGQLGNGTTTRRLKPAAVAGGLHFRQVSAGPEHTCGVTTDDRAFCWGLNTFGQLGNGTSDPSFNGKLIPVAVAGTLQFRAVSVGVYHSCGVTTTNRAYCWGGDQWGQIGDGPSSGSCPVSFNSLPCRKKPTLVTGGYRFRQVDAGGGQGPGEDGIGGNDGGRTCGVTTDDRAFCWGDGSHGQNGDGTLSLRSSPTLVAGGLHFHSLSTQIWHTCGATTDNLAYCWGWNPFGQLGYGSQETMRRTPKAVVGGHLFPEVSAGGAHTCGRTSGNVAYCWGGNSAGQLGDGTTTTRLRPRAVVGQM